MVAYTTPGSKRRVILLQNHDVDKTATVGEAKIIGGRASVHPMHGKEGGGYFPSSWVTRHCVECICGCGGEGIVTSLCV